jgi:hypothetical protein
MIVRNGLPDKGAGRVVSGPEPAILSQTESGLERNPKSENSDGEKCFLQGGPQEPRSGLAIQ